MWIPLKDTEPPVASVSPLERTDIDVQVTADGHAILTGHRTQLSIINHGCRVNGHTQQGQAAAATMLLIFCMLLHSILKGHSFENTWQAIVQSCDLPGLVS